MNILEQYVKNKPNPQLMIDLFKGEWSSIVPKVDSGGFADLFNDHRINLLASEIDQGFSNKSILELGPLEGGIHT